MYWTIDTGALGAGGCDSKDLRGVLEAAMEHLKEDAPEQAARLVMLAANTEKDPAKGGVGSDFTKHMQEKSGEAQAAKEALIAKLSKVEKAMADGIDAACKLAEGMGGQVTATVKGHYDPEHPSAIFRGIIVSVDRARPTED